MAARGLIDDAWALVAIDPRASGIAFTNLVDPEERVVGNPDRLVQVFVNLLRNAVNAGPCPVPASGCRSSPRSRRSTAAR